MKSIGEKLRYENRSLRLRPGSVMIGSSGARLCVDYLDPIPGFAGRIDFVHKMNIPVLFTVTADNVDCYEPAQSVWRPEFTEFSFENNRLKVREEKFITWDDVAVSKQIWTNKTKSPITLSLNVDPKAASFANGRMRGETLNYVHGMKVIYQISSSNGIETDPVIVGAGESAEFAVYCATGIKDTDDFEKLEQRIAQYAKRPLAELTAKHVEYYNEWFDKTPTMRSSDELLDRTYLYRWYVLRTNLMKPEFGKLGGYCMYEGRSHRGTRTPYRGGGWEFTKVINLSTPFHITDMRWYHDSSIIEGFIDSAKQGQDERGIFNSVFVDELTSAYTNFTVWASWQAYLATGNKNILAYLDVYKKNVRAETNVHGDGTDDLQIEMSHNRTGKEYQPSYWFFHNYPRNPKDRSTYTPLKRVDRSIYHYLNALGAANLCSAAGDPEADYFFKLADRIKRDVLSKMWDQNTEFFFDLHYKTNAKAFVKNIVGVYPYWAKITDDRHADGILPLMDKSQFNTKCLYPSVSKQNPMYSPDGGWKGNFIKGRNGCIWCGPSWPYTTGIALEALANESRRTGHKYDGDFAYGLRQYSFTHFLLRDINKPYLVEHYNPETGEPLSDEPEYNHSYYIELIMHNVAGLFPEKDGISVSPIDCGLDFFEFDNILIRGKNFRVTYNCAENSGDDKLEPGYNVYMDGKLVFSAPELKDGFISF